MYLLDADWIIQALGNREPAAQTLRRLEGSRLFVSCVTFGEIYERAFNSVNPDAHLLIFRQFLGAYPILGLSDPVMERFAELRAYLRRRGQLIPDFDLSIAAMALHHGLTPLTFNRRHFERVPELMLYQ